MHTVGEKGARLPGIGPVVMVGFVRQSTRIEIVHGFHTGELADGQQPLHAHLPGKQDLGPCACCLSSPGCSVRTLEDCFKRLGKG